MLSALRRFRASAALAVAHRGIVFLLFPLSLLPRSGRSWRFAEPGSTKILLSWTGVDWWPGIFSDLMACSRENTPTPSHSRGQPQNLESSHSTMPGKGTVRAKVLICSPGKALPEADCIHRKCTWHLTQTLPKCRIHTCSRPQPWVCPPVGDRTTGTKMVAHCGGMAVLGSPFRPLVKPPVC